jgi:hypothetical protein
LAVDGTWLRQFLKASEQCEAVHEIESTQTVEKMDLTGDPKHGK